MEDKIFEVLNDWVFGVETQAGEKLFVIDASDFKDIIKEIKDKLH